MMAAIILIGEVVACKEVMITILTGYYLTSIPAGGKEKFDYYHNWIGNATPDNWNLLVVQGRRSI